MSRSRDRRSPVHWEVGSSGYGVDGKEDGNQNEEGVTADGAEEILKKLPHFLDSKFGILDSTNNRILQIIFFSCCRNQAAAFHRLVLKSQNDSRQEMIKFL